MDFELSEEHKLFREMVRDFAEKEVAPGAIERDRTHAFPDDLIARMGALHLMGVPFPEKYGGAGGDTISYAIAVEEISRIDGSLGLILAAHTSLGASPFYLFGNEAQKQEWLVPLARGAMLGAFGLTEPNAGSDAGGTATYAERDGDAWVINGRKQWITSGRVAGVIVATAKTDRAAQGSRGISSFIIPKGTPGLSYGRDEDKMGLRSSITSALFFDDVRLPGDALLGEEGDGFKQFMQILDGGRISIGAMAIGLGQGAFDAAVAYAMRREQFGQPIANFQSIQFKLADMAMKLEASRLLVYKAAWLKDQHRPYSQAAAIAKLFASETGEECAYQAIQIHGGMGYAVESEVERMYRDVRLTTIGEGTSEIQRLVIARNLLKEAARA